MANATTYYTDKAHGSASDSNACTSESAPCLTINGGLGKMSGGDTLVIKAGAYTEYNDPGNGYAIVIPANINTNSSSRLTITNAPGETVTIQPSGCRWAVLTDIYSSQGFITVDGTNGTTYGIVLDGTNCTKGSDDDSGAGGIVTYGNSWIIRGIEIKNMPYFCTAGGAGSGSHLISRNSCHDTTNPGDYADDWSQGIDLNGPNSIVEYNQIYNVGLGAVPGPGAFHGCSHGNNFDCTNSTVRGNTIHNVLSAMSFYYFAGSTIYNNVIYDAAAHGMLVTQYGNGDFDIFNNTIYNSGTSCITLDSGANSMTVQNNICAGTNNTIVNSGSGNTQDHNICASACASASDPLFVNAAGGDFHLEAASDAIDAGVDLSAIFTIDYEGTTRSGTWEIGAYNFTSTPIEALVLSLDFNEGSGLPQDSSGYGNHVTALGSGNSWTAGHTGNGITFGGSAAATIADSNSLDLSTAFTLEAWIKPTTSPVDATGIIVKDFVYYIYSASSGFCVSGAAIGGYYTTDYVAACYSTPLTANVWTHVAVTYDSTLGSANLKFYVNGSQVATANGTATVASTSGLLYLGGSAFGELYTGVMDDVKVYNYARTAEQICTDGCGVPPAQVGPIFLYY